MRIADVLWNIEACKAIDFCILFNGRFSLNEKKIVKMKTKCDNLYKFSFNFTTPKRRLFQFRSPGLEELFNESIWCKK